MESRRQGVRLSHYFHPQSRHATISTFVASYLFPALFVAYETCRVGYWIAFHDPHFSSIFQ